MKYAILDIETTGGSPVKEKITEIAIYIHDGTKIIHEFSSLINPEKNIPPFITGLTGISNEMVADSPKFYEIARKIVELTEHCVFVGHNVSFDYGFIQNEFKQLGYEYKRDTLCTVKMSRKLFPGYPSYSLGKICQHLNIAINGRHRAAGDAFATVKLFELILQKNQTLHKDIPIEVKPAGRIKNLNGFLTPEKINEVPASTGVYYLHDIDGNLLYVGKSTNIHSRILSHLGNRASRRANELRERIAGISFELTGSELIALLLESEEIKKHMPRYNRAQRRNNSAWGLFAYKDGKGYINFKIGKTRENQLKPVTCFNNAKEGKVLLSAFIEKHWLCQKLCGLYDTEGACFHYEIQQCNGACIGKEPISVYNKRAEKVIRQFSFDHQNMLIIDEGRSLDERSLIAVESGIYKGFGYVDVENTYLQIDDMKSCIKKASDNQDVRHIIQNWIRKNRHIKIIRY